MAWDWLVWIVPIAVLAAGLRSPRGGLLVLFGTLPLFGSPPGGPYLAALDVAALAAIATAWRARAPAPNLLDRAAVGVVVVGVASLLPLLWLPPAWSPRVLLGALEALAGAERWTTLYSWRAAANLLLGWLLYRAVRRAFAGESPRALGTAVAIGLLPLLALGLLEGAGWIDLWSYRPIGRAIYGARVHSLFFHSGWLAEYLVLATPFALGAVAGRKRWLMAALGVLGPAVLLLTLQRGGWYAALAETLVAGTFLALRWREAAPRGVRLGAALALSAVLVGGLAWVRPAVRDALGLRAQSAVSDLSARSWVWRQSVRHVRERPVLGWGVGSFSPVFDADSRAEPRSWLTAHNHYLMVMFEQGLLGLAAWGAMLGAAVWTLGRVLRSRAPAERERRRLAVALLTSGAGALVYGMVQYLFFVRAIEWLCWGLLAAIAGLEREVSPGRGRRLLGALLALLAVALPARFLWVEPLVGRAGEGYGLHAPERTADGAAFRWTEGHAAFRIAREGPAFVLPLANGRAEPAERPVAVTVRVDGHEALRTVVRDGWQEHWLEVEPNRRDPVLIEISARPTFRPYREPATAGAERSRDIRRLGIALGEIRWLDVMAGK